MVTLNTLLLVGMIAAGVASVATVAFFLLLGVYLNTKAAKKDKEDDDEDGIFTVPLSALGGGAGVRTITQADVDEARRRFTAHQAAGAPPAPGGEEKTPEYEPGKGAYL